MKAYQLIKGTKVIVKDCAVGVPPHSIPVYQDEVLTLGKLDGIYCNAINEKGDKVYIHGLTEVHEIINND
jgi:hypothetical protein